MKNMNENKKVVCYNQENEKKEVNASELIWRPSVYGLLIRDNKILLSPQWDGYDFPGGGADMHETIEDTLKREFWEETGLKVEQKEIVHCQTSFFVPKFCKEYWNCVLIYFLCEQVGGELSIENFDEHEKHYAGMPEWVDIDRVDDIVFHNGIDSPKLIIKVVKMLKEKNGK